jgi:hypothetical protein
MDRVRSCSRYQKIYENVCINDVKRKVTLAIHDRRQMAVHDRATKIADDRSLKEKH